LHCMCVYIYAYICKNYMYTTYQLFWRPLIVYFKQNFNLENMWQISKSLNVWYLSISFFFFFDNNTVLFYSMLMSFPVAILAIRIISFLFYYCVLHWCCFVSQDLLRCFVIYMYLYLTTYYWHKNNAHQ
jgi:hypothetical protein